MINHIYSYSYKLAHRKEIAQIEELLDISLTRVLEYHRRNCSYVSFNEAINHAIYGSFIIDEDDRHENDTEDYRESVCGAIAANIVLDHECSSDTEYLQQTWGYKCYDVKKIAMQEAANSLTTIQVIPSESTYNEFVEMIGDVEAVLDEYGKMLDNLDTTDTAYTTGGLEKCLGYTYPIPAYLKLKIKKYANVYFRYCFYFCYWEGKDFW